MRNVLRAVLPTACRTCVIRRCCRRHKPSLEFQIEMQEFDTSGFESGHKSILFEWEFFSKRFATEHAELGVRLSRAEAVHMLRRENPALDALMSGKVAFHRPTGSGDASERVLCSKLAVGPSAAAVAIHNKLAFVGGFAVSRLSNAQQAGKCHKRHLYMAVRSSSGCDDGSCPVRAGYLDQPSTMVSVRRAQLEHGCRCCSHSRMLKRSMAQTLRRLC